MTAVLELREVSKVYGTGAAEVDALRGVSLSVMVASWWRSWGRAARARARC